MDLLDLCGGRYGACNPTSKLNAGDVLCHTCVRFCVTSKSLCFLRGCLWKTKRVQKEVKFEKRLLLHYAGRQTSKQ